MKLYELIEEWLYNYHKDSVKQQTFVRYDCAYKNYLQNDEFSQRKIKKITARDVQEFINRLKRQKSRKTKMNLSANTINILITVLQSAFTYAVDFDLLKDNPCSKIKRVTNKAERKVEAFTVQEQMEIEKYIKSLNNPEYYGIILCLYTGLRIGELVALEWDDIDFEKGIMSINKTIYTTKNEDGDWYFETSIPKTRTSKRQIPLPSYILDELKELKQTSKSKNIVSMNDGSFLKPKQLRERFMRLLKKIKVSRLNFHALRHTFATRPLESGMDVRTLADIMGHANSSITLNIYAHSMTDHKKNMMNNIPRLFAYQ